MNDESDTTMNHQNKQELEEHLEALRSQLDLVYTEPMVTGDYGPMSEDEVYNMNFLEGLIEDAEDELEELDED